MEPINIILVLKLQINDFTLYEHCTSYYLLLWQIRLAVVTADRLPAVPGGVPVHHPGRVHLAVREGAEPAAAGW